MFEIFKGDLRVRIASQGSDGIYVSNRAGKKKECFPSVKTIAKDLRLSKSTVFRALNDLENAGLIEREERYRISGGRSSTLYRVKG